MPALGNALGLPYRKNGLGFVGALDAYTTSLTGAWSVRRRLLTSYTGPLIRVRRSSDNAEQNIGATGTGSLDTSSLLTFVGAGDGRVVTLYDQAGSNNYTQATAINQPLIVASGSLRTDDGTTPAIYFGTSVEFLASSAWSGSAVSAYYVARVTDDPTTSYIGALVGDVGTAAATDTFPFTDGNVYYGLASNARKSCGNPTPALNAAFLATCVSASANWNLRVNSAAFYSTGTNTVGLGAAPRMGGTTLYAGQGWLRECVYYSAAHSSTEWAGIEPVFQP